jgi:hypothetical protein
MRAVLVYRYLQRKCMVEKRKKEVTHLRDASLIRAVVFRARPRVFANLQESIQGTAQGYIRLHLRGLDIKNVEPGLLGLGRSDPFFEIAKKNSDVATGIVAWYV